VSARVWIPGASGQLGRACQRLLAGGGHAALATGRDLPIDDAAAVRAFVQREEPTHLLNCAAYTAVDKAESEPDLARAVNAEGPGNLARAFTGPALHVSTDYVFPGDQTRPYREDDPTGPTSVYGETKLAGERAFLASDLGPRTVVRSSWVFGREGHNFVRTMLRLMQGREELNVVDDQRGRPTFAEHLAAACLDLLGLRSSPAAEAGTYHFASAGECTWFEFAEEILRRGKARGLTLRCARVNPIPTRDYPTPAARPGYSVLDTTRIEAALGRPCPPWTEGLDALLDDRIGA
jgi:dTDP-4-dehydrorhamnose reductase